ncbi:MAG TPA: hypothetical protein PLY73_15425 [Candidatus Ozemobacteraceae bacterium]|nr:hypothetical protein [Candidatus Ozemobacteraceae bacterium]
MRRAWFHGVMLVTLMMVNSWVYATERDLGRSQAVQEFMAAQRQKSQAFQEAENNDGKAFMAALAGKPKAEKIAAVRTFKTEQYEKNCAFREQMMAEWDAFLATQGSSNVGAAQGRREMMKQRMAEQNSKIKAFFAQKHAENMAFLDRMLADSSMDGAALDKEMSTFFQNQKASAKEHMDSIRRPAGKGR